MPWWMPRTRNAATITANATTACAELGLPHLVLARPAWEPTGVTLVGSNAEAVEMVARKAIRGCS